MATTAEQQQQIIIEHVHLPVRGLSLHVAQAGGKGELGMVVYLHGFPEIWYSWRYQMLVVATARYHAVAPDWRGYSLSEQLPEPEAAEFDDLIEDPLTILDALAVTKQPGRVEADFEDNLTVYSSLYEKSGFRYPLQMPYMSLHQRKPIGDVKFQVPVFVVMGEKDYVFKFPGIESIMKDERMKKHAPDLKITYIPEGGHFAQEQFPDCESAPAWLLERPPCGCLNATHTTIS